MKLSNKTYDTAKWAILIVVPALITLISGLGTVYGYDTTHITAVIGLISAFVGTVLGISTHNYNKE